MQAIVKAETARSFRLPKGGRKVTDKAEIKLPTPEEYQRIVDKKTPGTRKIKGFFRAFWVGGTICAVGCMIEKIGNALEIPDKILPMYTSSVMIYLGCLLTGAGFYDRIGKYAGAGSIVPITGFANSVCAPAMEFRREGMITGIGVKMFTVAGPVLAYGISASVIYGLVYYLKGCIGG